jgi:hydrogenase-1 operon protein HyaF
MGGLQDIPVRRERTLVAHGLTRNVVPILHEIRHALDLLADSGKATIIDLTAMPFGSDDEAQLRAALGEGEVVATVNALGESCMQETGYSGVWLVEHRSPEQVRTALHLEVAEVPFLLKTPIDDLRAARRRLSNRLNDIDGEITA